MYMYMYMYICVLEFKLFEHVAHLAWSGLVLYALRNMLHAGTHNMLLWHFV